MNFQPYISIPALPGMRYGVFDMSMPSFPPNGADMTREEALDRVKQSSRQYAKRQLTWLRRDPDIRWIIWEQSPDIPAAARRIAGDWERAGQNFPSVTQSDGI